MPFASSSSEPPDNEAIRELRDEMKRLRKSTDFSIRVMMGWTIALIVLTAVLIWQGTGD